MEYLTKENFDQTIRSGKKLLLCLYRKNHPGSTLALERMKEINALIARDFECYLIDTENQPEINYALDFKEAPEYISIKNSKIHSRASGYLYTNQILDLLKEKR